MKKKICALMLTLLLMFAFSVNCLAWVSPTQTAVPTKETGGGNILNGPLTLFDPLTPVI